MTDDNEDYFGADDGMAAHPESHVAQSLNNALQQLREDAEALGSLPEDERAEAAERIAESTAKLDEQIARASRADDD